MAHAENEVTINRPAPEVYAFLADVLNNPKWRSGVQGNKTMESEVAQLRNLKEVIEAG